MSDNMRVTVRTSEFRTVDEAYAEASLTFAMAKESPRTTVVAWSPSSVTKTMKALFGVYYVIPKSGRNPGHVITVFFKLKKNDDDDTESTSVLTQDYEVVDPDIEGNDSL